MARMIRLGGVALAVALSAALGASAGAQEEPDVEADSDAVLEEIIQQRLERDSFLEEFDIRVEVNDGHAILRGQVEAEHEKEEAERLAETVDGVTSVENEILVGKGLGEPDALPPIVEPQPRGPGLQ